MGEDDTPKASGRKPLNRERVVATAIALADDDGLEPLTMRRLGDALGVSVMSLYNHVANKEELLRDMVDAVFAEIDLPSGDEHWKEAMRRRALSFRAVLARHRWAIGLMDSNRAPGPATLRHHDAVLGCLRGAGFSLELAAHAYSVLDSYVYGFTLQEQSLPVASPGDVRSLAQELAARLSADEYPHLAELTLDHVLRPGYDFGEEYEFGLDLVLDGLDRAFART